MPLDLIATEQQRISSQLATIEERVNTTTATFEEIETNLARALDLARDCHAAYLAAEPRLRRLSNQAFFTHLYIDDDDVRHNYAEPFDTLLGKEILDVGRAILDDPETRQITMADILKRSAILEPNHSPPRRTAPWGLLVGSSAPVQGVEGSNRSSLVHLRDSLSNPSKLLSRLIRVLGEAGGVEKLQFKGGVQDAIIAKTGAATQSRYGSE
jgi:site-specific DNA recombinase